MWERLRDTLRTLEFVFFRDRAFNRSWKESFEGSIGLFDHAAGLVQELREKWRRTRSLSERKSTRQRIGPLLESMSTYLSMADTDLSRIHGSKAKFEARLDSARELLETLSLELGKGDLGRSTLPVLVELPSRPEPRPGKRHAYNLQSSTLQKRFRKSGICDCGCVLPKKALSCPNCGRKTEG